MIPIDNCTSFPFPSFPNSEAVGRLVILPNAWPKGRTDAFISILVGWARILDVVWGKGGRGKGGSPGRGKPGKGGAFHPGIGYAWVGHIPNHKS